MRTEMHPVRLRREHPRLTGVCVAEMAVSRRDPPRVSVGITSANRALNTDD